MSTEQTAALPEGEEQCAEGQQTEEQHTEEQQTEEQHLEENQSAAQHLTNSHIDNHHLAVVGALLFASRRPLSVDQLSGLANLPEELVRNIVDHLTIKFANANCGFSLEEVAGGYQFRTDPNLGAVVSQVIRQKRRPLSRAASETLALVSFRQPISKAEIESIRGVDPTPTIKTLLQEQLIAVVGQEETPGKPVLFGTTAHFLERFGLRDLSELPSIRELESIAEDPGEAIEL